MYATLFSKMTCRFIGFAKCPHALRRTFIEAIAEYYKTINDMESNQKQLYEAPETLEIEVRMEGLVATSVLSTEQYSVYGTAYGDEDFN